MPKSAMTDTHGGAGTFPIHQVRTAFPGVRSNRRSTQGLPGSAAEFLPSLFLILCRATCSVRSEQLTPRLSALKRSTQQPFDLTYILLPT